MDIYRSTRERLYKDESLFNNLLPYVKWDEERQVFIHADASLWSIWELKPIVLSTISTQEAFQITSQIQEILDSFDHTISVQFNWVTTFDVEDILQKNIKEYPLDGVAGFMARRWVKMLKNMSKSYRYGTRTKKQRLYVAFRYDAPWVEKGLMAIIKETFNALLNAGVAKSDTDRYAEYRLYAEKFSGEINGKVQRFGSFGLYPERVDGQGLIDVLYPLLNRRSTKGGKFKRSRVSKLAVPEFDSDEILANQVSDTLVKHPDDGFIIKDGKVYHTVSMVKPPKQCLPFMTIPLQSLPYESFLSVTYSKDSRERQMKKLDKLDSIFGLRLSTPGGRANQEVYHKIENIRMARDELYSNRSQLVRTGVHCTVIADTIDEAQRASGEVLSIFPTLNGARGMAHKIADLGVFVNSLPGAYDPSTDGAGWTSMMQSSRATRLFPIWGNWTGTKNPLFVLPTLWNKELVGFDLYDSNIAPNVIVSGVSGAGKSYLLCFLLITLGRGHFSDRPDGTKLERPPITFVFDKGMPNQPCGFERVARLFNGRVYQATPSKAPAMNFLARLGEMDPDKTSGDFKDIFDICVDIIADMSSDRGQPIAKLQRNEIIDSLNEAHYRYRHGEMDREFLLRDVIKVLKEPPRPSETEDHFNMRQELVVMMREYYGDGTYARFFDRPGRLELKERFIVFDLKGLSRNPDLQRIFLKVAMIWADEVMNDPKELDTRKVLVFDEAHDLVGKTQAGVVEAAFRLYRKRKGIVIAASQSGEDFYAGEGGQAIVQNSSHKIFLRQDPSKFHITSRAFNLNPQQSETILGLQTLKGVESQFFLLSDIGQSALSLPLEPAFYWVSTNNGDDNQLFSALLEESDGDFLKALQRAVVIAPTGAKDLAERRKMIEQYLKDEEKQDPRSFIKSGQTT